MAFVIVGASLAGVSAAAALREQGYSGELVLLGQEEEQPYERPPLSKGYLLGDADGNGRRDACEPCREPDAIRPGESIDFGLCPLVPRRCFRIDPAPGQVLRIALESTVNDETVMALGWGTPPNERQFDALATRTSDGVQQSVQQSVQQIVISRAPAAGRTSQNRRKKGNSSPHDSAVSIAMPRADIPKTSSRPSARK